MLNKTNNKTRAIILWNETLVVYPRIVPLNLQMVTTYYMMGQKSGNYLYNEKRWSHGNTAGDIKYSHVEYEIKGMDQYSSKHIYIF